MRILSRSAAVALIAAAIAGAAIAQDQSPQQGTSSGRSWSPRGMMGYGSMGAGMVGPDIVGPGMMGNGAMGAWMMGAGGSAQAMCDAMSSHIEGRLAYIKAELKVTDAQEPLWNTYAVAARDNAKTMIARCTAMMGRPSSQVSLPDRLDQNEQLMATQLEAVRAMNKALKPLYAALSDDQKKAADQLFLGPMGMM